MKETKNNYKLVYKTTERKNHLEENCHWYEFRLRGDIIYKYRCQIQKIHDGSNYSDTTEEEIEESWVANSPFLPDFLKQKIKNSKDPEIKKFSEMRTIENTKDNEHKSFFKTHKKSIIICGSVTAAVIGALLLYKNPQVLSKIINLDLSNKISPKDIDTVIEAVANQKAIPVQETISAVRSVPTEPYKVKAFVRQLPKGWHASEMAIQNAANAGITLEEGQTFVTEFIKYLSSAA